MKTMCMALECRNEIERHPYNFDDGFCPTCKALKNGNLLEHLKKK